MSKVLGVRLVTGDEIVASVEETDKGLNLKNPVKIAVAFTAEGPGMQFLPLSFGAKEGSLEDLTVAKEHVVYTFVPSEQVNQSYCEATGAVIVPDSGLIL